jgi:hypothetical protein
MKLPASIHGRYADVAARCRKMVTAFRKGAPWAEVVGEDTLDTQEVPGLIVLDGPAPNLGFEEHFHCFAPIRALGKVQTRAPWPPEAYAAISAACLTTHGGLLSLLGQDGRSFLAPAHRPAFLHQVRRWWPDFAAEGRRFTVGTQVTYELWELPTTIGFALAQVGGLTSAQLRTRASAADLLALIDDVLARARPPET